MCNYYKFDIFYYMSALLCSHGMTVLFICLIISNLKIFLLNSIIFITPELILLFYILSKTAIVFKSKSSLISLFFRFNVINTFNPKYILLNNRKPKEA